MKRLFVLILLISSLVLPVGAVEYTAPDVPQNVEDIMPVETESFGEGLWKIIQNVTEDLRPRLISAVKLSI